MFDEFDEFRVKHEKCFQKGEGWDLYFGLILQACVLFITLPDGGSNFLPFHCFKTGIFRVRMHLHWPCMLFYTYSK